MSDVRIEQLSPGVTITVDVAPPVAVVLRGDGTERIYISPTNTTDDSYYNATPETLQKTEEGYTVTYQEPVSTCEILTDDFRMCREL